MDNLGPVVLRGLYVRDGNVVFRCGSGSRFGVTALGLDGNHRDGTLSPSVYDRSECRRRIFHVRPHAGLSRRIILHDLQHPS